MDPASATGLAAAILQLGVYTGKVLSRSLEYYETADGALLRHSELKDIASSFQQKLQDVKKRAGHARKSHDSTETNSSEPNANIPESAGTELESLAIKAEAVTQELLDLLQSLTIEPGPRHGWKSVRSAILTVWKDSKLRDLEERLARYRSQIDSVLLYDINSYVMKAQAEQKRQRKTVLSYAELVQQRPHSGDDQNTHAQSIAQRAIRDATKVKPEGLDVPKSFATEVLNFFTQDEAKIRERRINKLKDALDFQELPARHQAIPDAYAKTFDWIYEPPKDGASKYTWSDFTEWLKGDDSLYWIAGKPGAGKSTLMKYLYDHPRTREIHNSSNVALETTMAGFFFWNSGSEMQMSRVGFVRSLLTQLCSSDFEPWKLFPRRWQRCELLGWSEESFTWDELLSALDTVLTDPTKEFLLFIDGMDEFDGSKDELIDLTQKLSSKPNVKVCAASRPWVEFQSRFQDVPQLLIENLTRDDIAHYVKDRFASSREFCAMRTYEKAAAEKLENDVIDKASGVFLWVYVVTTTLLQGCRDGDDMNDLVRKLDSLPPELDEMFDRILQQVQPAHQQEASELFQYMRAHPSGTTLISIYWSRLQFKDAVDAEIRRFSDDETTYHMDRMKRLLLSRCKCLIDVSLHIGPPNTAPVTWLHRSVREYCQKAEVWAKIKEYSPDYDPDKALTLSLLRQAKAGVTSDSSSLSNVEYALGWAVGRSQTLDTLEDRISFFDQVESTGLAAKAVQFPEQGNLAMYWLSPGAVAVPAFKGVKDMLGPQTTMYHAALQLGWEWYVKHRITLDPQIIYKPVAISDEYTTLQVAADLNMWDIQCMCLEEGQTQDRNQVWMEIVNSSWRILFERIQDFKAEKALNKEFPWCAFMRSLHGFLEYGVDLSLMSRDQLTAKSELEWVVDMARGNVPADELEAVKSLLQKGMKSHPQKEVTRKRDRLWKKFR